MSSVRGFFSHSKCGSILSDGEIREHSTRPRLCVRSRRRLELEEVCRSHVPPRGRERVRDVRWNSIQTYGSLSGGRDCGSVRTCPVYGDGSECSKAQSTSMIRHAPKLTPNGQSAPNSFRGASISNQPPGGPDCGISGSDFGRSLSAWPKLRLTVRKTARDW